MLLTVKIHFVCYYILFWLLIINHLVLSKLYYNLIFPALNNPSVIKNWNAHESGNVSFNLFRMGLFGAAQGWGVPKRPPIPKTYQTYPTMMKLVTVIPYLKKTPKIYESRDTRLDFCWNQHFFIKNQQILLYQEIQI